MANQEEATRVAGAADQVERVGRVGEEENRPAAPPPRADPSGVVDRQPEEKGRRRTWALLAFDSATGCATTIVAIAGVDGDGGPGAEAVSWMPLVDSAGQGWRDRLSEGSGEPLAVVVEGAVEGGAVAVDIEELAPPKAADLWGAVEILMDEVLATPTEVAAG